MAKKSTYKRVTGSVSTAKTVARRAKSVVKKVMPKKKAKKAKRAKKKSTR